MENQKVTGFVDHLLSNPNLSNEPPLIQEGVVLNFIVKNLKQLQITFQSPQFFPELSAKEALNLIFDDLKNRTIEQVKPLIEKHISLLNFDVVIKNSKSQPLTPEFYAEKLNAFVLSIFENKDVRYNFNAIVNILENDIIEKYINECFRRRSPLFFELVRVGKRNFSQEEYINYLKIMLLVRSSAYMKKEIDGFTDAKVSIKDFIKVPKTLNQYFEVKAASLNKQLPGIPKSLVKNALKSNIGISNQETEDTPAKFLYILCNRFQTYKEYTKIDRGAESPDKSWFGTARKNSNYYGFDKRMLEDLYIISGDNNW